MKFFSGSLFDDYETWDNQPGGKVVNRYREDGVEFVEVEFDNSPGVRYKYFARRPK